jgi:hypothetical protein
MMNMNITKILAAFIMPPFADVETATYLDGEESDWVFPEFDFSD